MPLTSAVNILSRPFALSHLISFKVNWMNDFNLWSHIVSLADRTRETLKFKKPNVRLIIHGRHHFQIQWIYDINHCHDFISVRPLSTEQNGMDERA